MKNLNENQKKNLAMNFARWKARQLNHKGKIIFDAMTFDFWLENDLYTFDSMLEAVERFLAEKPESEREIMFEKLTSKII